MHANQANKKDVRDKLSRLFLYQIQGEKPIQPAVNCLSFLGNEKLEAVQNTPKSDNLLKRRIHDAENTSNVQNI